jgi:superfamily II DNA or RNA helicase
MASKKMSKKASAEPTGIQAYYTRTELAQAIMERAKYVLPTAATVLDLCAGQGRLFKALHHKLDKSPWLVEPDDAAFEYLAEHFEDTRNTRLFHMCAEEFCLMHAAPELVDVVVCNPPFGERIGRTGLGEFCKELHLPELAYFELYFIYISCMMARTTCVFLLPENTIRRDGMVPMLRTLADAGWSLYSIHELPLDGYEGAQVRTHAWVLTRQPAPCKQDWPAALHEAITSHSVPALFVGAIPTTVSHRTGTLDGYLFNAIKPDHRGERALAPVWTPSTKPLTAQAERMDPGWKPAPLELGHRMERMGKMYELTRTGFVLAQGDGFADGVPAGPEFMRAERAAYYMRQGALHTASALMVDTNVAKLVRGFGEMPGASFLHMLTCLKPTPSTHPMLLDLERMGQLDGVRAHERATLLPAKHPGIHTLGQSLYAPASMKPAQLAQLALCCLADKNAEPGWLTLALAPLLERTQLISERLELRATWWPRDVVARLLGLRINEQGFYAYADTKTSGSLPWTSLAGRCANYLNYGKTGRMGEDARDNYAELCDQVALALTTRDPAIPAALRREIQLHYMLAYSPGATRAHAAPPQARPAKPLRAWQVKDRKRMLRGDQINNWDVGLGKTLGALNAAASHPGTSLIVVPNSVIMKWMHEARTFFPHIKIGLLGLKRTKTGKLTPSYGTLAEDAARLFYKERCQIIFTSHDVFNRIQIPRDIERAHDIEDANALLGTSQKRHATKQRESFIQHAAQRNFILGSHLTFCDLPLGSMFLVVDEAHKFKSLFPMPSSGWGSTLVMAGGCGTSKRARNMKIKCDLLREAGGKVLALTATPVTNSVAEIFNMLRIYAPEQLNRLGLTNTQQFIDMFCVMEDINTLKPSGEPVYGQTIAGFRQLKRLRSIWNQCMITRTATDVGLVLPEASEVEVTIPPTPAIRAFLDQCKDELDRSLKGIGKDKDDPQMHIFSILSRMDSVAAWPPIVGIEDENPKLTELMQRVIKHYHEGGNQLVFVDRTSAHEGVRDKLIAAGIPADQIAVFNADETSDVGTRLTLADAYNDGKLRVAIGGTMISEGMDLQHNTTALHFMNLSWESQTIHQRKGRGVRQGNTVDTVHIYYYLLESSTDVYRRAVTAKKSHWWEKLRSCQTDHLPVCLVASPIEDGLLISLAKDPDAVREKLYVARGDAALRKSCVRAQALLRAMLMAADPTRIQLALPILKRLERTLRGLEGFTPELCDQLIARVSSVAQALHGNAVLFAQRMSYPRDEWHRIIELFNAYRGGNNYSLRSDWKKFCVESKQGEDGLTNKTLRWAHSTLVPVNPPNAGFIPATTWLDAHNTADSALSHIELDALDEDEADEPEDQDSDVWTNAEEDEDLVFLEQEPELKVTEQGAPEPTPQAVAATPQPELFTPSAKAAPVAAVTPLRTRTTAQRVLDLLALYDAVEVAHAFDVQNSFLFTKWLRGQRLDGGLGEQITRTVARKLADVEKELARKHRRLAS